VDFLNLPPRESSQLTYMIHALFSKSHHPELFYLSGEKLTDVYELRPDFTDLHVGGTPPNLVCFNCNKQGHFAKECR